MKTVIFLLTAAMLSGCAGIGGEALTTITDTITGSTTVIAGTAAQRDALYMNRGNHRDSQDKAMYKLSGVNIENEMVILADGSMAYLPKTITVRAPHVWGQNIETRPPDHRGWRTADKALDVLGTGLIGYFLSDAYKGKTTGTVYKGDYNPQTAAPYIVYPEIVTTP